MKVRRCFFILMFFALCGVGVYAQQPQMGELIYDESGCFFRVISLSPGRVAVVHPPAGISSFAHYSGVVRVPDTVWYTSSRPLQVYAVADSAFFNCSSLTKVELPATLRTIGVDAFSGTSSLDTIRCYGEIPPEMYYDAINLRSSMGNLTRGDDYTRYKDIIVLRVPCSGMDNYTSVQGWARFSNTTGESMFMLYKDTICEGQNYNNHQFSLTKPSSGTYQKINIPGGLGCTYDAELHLVVHPVYENVYAYYFCNDSSLSYNANGFHINDWTGGAYAWTQALLSVHGCDSISHLEFRRLMGEMDFYDEVCMGAPYLRIFNETLLFELLAWETDTPDFDTVITKNFEPENDTMTAYQERCLQTIKTHIHVNPILRDTLVANSCEGYPYTWTRTGYNASRVSITHSDTYSVSGFYCDTMFSNKGCLMYKNLDLYVWPPNDTVLYDTICGNECLLFGNSYVRTEGVLTAKYANQHLCDSNVALHLTVRNSYSDGQSGYTRVPIYHSDFNQSEDRFAWKFANGYNGWRVKNGYLRVSSGESTNNYNLNQQSDSYAYLTYNTGDYDSIWIEMPIVVGGESYMDYFRVLLPGTASSTSLFNTNSVYRVGYKNTRHNQTDTLTLHWHNNANGRGNQAAVIVNELTVTGVSHQLRNHAPVGIVANICQGDVFNKNGHSYNTTGVYPIDYFTVEYGCDSLVQLNLTVHEHSDSSFVKEMCDGGSFVFDGVRYTQTTTVTNNYEDRWGCDSIRRLDLTVWPTPITEIDTVHLGDNPLYFGGRSITEDGSYTFHYSTSHGCDSTVILNVTIHHNQTTTISASICDGETYSDNGFNESAPGRYTRHVQAVTGADSTIILNLTVNPVYDDTLDITICDRQTYLFGGRSYGVAGYYTDSLHTYRGCDSVVTLHLNVNPVFDTVVYDTVRGDEGYWFYDVHYDSTGIYRDTLPNRYGCDSITELHLQIYNTATTHLYDTICDRDVYEGYGFSGQTVTGTYRLNLQTFAGADSTVYLHLWVNPVYDDTLDITICDRQTYLFGGRSYGVAGYYTDSLHTYKGCDSVVTLHLIVNPVYEVDVYDTVRGDDGYWFFGTHLDTTGVYCDTLPTQQGCDSIIFLHLQIYNTATTHLYDTICDRDVYEGYGFSGLTTVGIYVDSLLTYGGADSLVYLHLWVNPVYEVDVYDTICSNRFLIHHGDTLRRAGDYTDTLPSVLGCDSIITMHLFVKESYSDTFYAEICQGGSYFFHIEEPLTEEGLYRFYMHGINGCDSIETLLLTVHPIYNYTIEDSILPTENYVFGNRIIYDPGFYSDTLSSQFGCDSIVNLQLRNWYLHTTRLRDTICDGDSVFFNNQWCKRDSVYTDTLLADDGADSLVVLFLKVSPVYNDTLFDSIFCTEFYLFGDDTIRLEGLYTHHLLTERGCDSTVTLNLYVHTVRDIDSVVCMDRLPFIWNGITFPDTLVTSPIVYKDTAIVWNDTAGRNIMLAMRVTVVPNPIQTIADTIVENQLPYSFRGYVYEGNVESDTLLLPATVGCDTTTYYSLFYYPNVAATADTTVCYGQLPLEWNGVTFQVPEGVLSITQTATLRAHTGADSVLTMNVNVLQNTYTTRHDTIVENLLPYEVHGHIYFGACNLDTLVIPNSVGCDSVIYFRLLVNGNGVTMLDTTLCDDLLPINWNGHNFDDDGSTDLLSDTTIYHNQLGADSMVIMRVHILRCSSQVFDSTVCSAQLPLRWNGRTFNLPQDMPTTLVDTIHLYTPSGADSLIILRLRVNESFDQTFYDTICANHPYSFLGEQYASDCILNASLQSHFGCDSSVVVHLKVWPTETSSFEDIICPNTVYRWIDGNAYTEPVLGPFTTLRTVHGCDSTVYLHLIEGEPAVADIWSDKTWVKVDEPTVRLVDHTLHGDSRVWQFPDSVSTYEELDYTYPSDYDSVRIYLIATNHDGCVDTASLLLRLDRDFIWVPNVFTPALNENNHFQVFGQGLTDVKVSIYTGTGLFIYSWEGMDGYWDGTHDGKLCPQAAYTYKVTYATERNPRGYNTQVGTVVLLR